MKKAVSKTNYTGHAAQKVRLFADEIRGKNAVKVLEQLTYSTGYNVRPVVKCLKAAIANAKVLGLNEETLKIDKIIVNEATPMKRFRVRSRRGMGTILKKSSHILIELSE